MNTLVERYRTRKETTYNAFLCVIGAIFWFGAALYLITADDQERSALLILSVYVVPFLIIVLISSLLFRANAMGNMVRVSDEQYPHIHKMICEGSKTLGIPPPEAFIYNSNGFLNAFARQVFGRNYLLLTSAIVDATSDDQVKFVIGHELAHHAAGHLDLAAVILRLPARIIPLLHKAYSREREFTCDRLGLVISQDLESASKAIAVLGCGCHRLTGNLNLVSFERQENDVPEVSGFVAELFRTHPRLTRRLISLKNTILDNSAR